MIEGFASYMVVSFMVAGGVVAHAARVHQYFFGSTVYLYNSKFALLAFGNLGLAMILLLGKVLQAVCLGPLRLRESERLHNRIRDAVIETCMAMTVFREEFNAKFVGMLAILLFLKIFHWLSKDRVEYMEEQPHSPLLQHGRLIALMVILFFLDVHLLVACVSYSLNHGFNMLGLFSFEFSVLMISLLSNVVRYIFLSADVYFEGAWESKGMFSFYNELLATMLQLCVYVMFFIYVFASYGVPIHLIRELWLTFNNFWKRWSDFKRYRRVMSTMNELFEDATEEELEAGDGVCIICRDELQVSAKKLSCGHIFHKLCLQSWLKNQLNCPTCRRSVDVNLIRPQPTVENEGEPEPEQAQNQNDRGRGLDSMRRRFFSVVQRHQQARGQNPDQPQGQQEAATPGAENEPSSGATPDTSAVPAHDASAPQTLVRSRGQPPADENARVQARALPLDRLIKVQEQLEMLRFEVRDLVIEATLATDLGDAGDEEEEIEPEATGAQESCEVTSRALETAEQSKASSSGASSSTTPRTSFAPVRRSAAATSEPVITNAPFAVTALPQPPAAKLAGPSVPVAAVTQTEANVASASVPVSAVSQPESKAAGSSLPLQVGSRPETQPVSRTLPVSVDKQAYLRSASLPASAVPQPEVKAAGSSATFPAASRPETQPASGSVRVSTNQRPEAKPVSNPVVRESPSNVASQISTPSSSSAATVKVAFKPDGAEADLTESS